MAENVKYYINGKLSDSITLTDADSTNSIDVQVLDASAEPPKDFIFKQFVKVTSPEKWTTYVQEAVDEKGSIAFLPFGDQPGGKNQIYAGGNYYGGGNVEVDSEFASFKDGENKIKILTVEDGKLKFISYQAIALKNTATGNASFEFDYKKTGGTVTLSATFNKDFTTSGWSGEGLSNNNKSGYTQTATGTFESNTTRTWYLSVEEIVGNPADGGKQATLDISQTVKFYKSGYGYFWGLTPTIQVQSPADGLEISVVNSGDIISNVVKIPNDSALTTAPNNTITFKKPTQNVDARFLYFFVKGDVDNSTYKQKYKINGAVGAADTAKIGTFTAYSKSQIYSLFVFTEQLEKGTDAILRT